MEVTKQQSFKLGKLYIFMNSAVNGGVILYCLLQIARALWVGVPFGDPLGTLTLSIIGFAVMVGLFQRKRWGYWGNFGFLGFNVIAGLFLLFSGSFMAIIPVAIQGLWIAYFARRKQMFI